MIAAAMGFIASSAVENFNIPFDFVPLRSPLYFEIFLNDWLFQLFEVPSTIAISSGVSL